VAVALVTGSSRGLGAAIARRLAADGLEVAVNGVADPEGAEAVVDRIRAEGGDAAAFLADVTDAHQVGGLVRAVAETFGPLDVLVLNATGAQPEGSLEEVPWSEYLAQLDFFLKSPVVLVQEVLAGMKSRGWGRIIQVDSEVVDVPPPGRSAYVAAKAAQVGVTRAWARELAPFGITVNSVAPGFVPVERHADVRAEVRADYVASVPAGRFGTPEEIAYAVSFFAASEAGFITGQRLVVDGGRGLGG
jgi:3-oxoacyl-[acyl-carrier protein] reductase